MRRPDAPVRAGSTPAGKLTAGSVGTGNGVVVGAAVGVGIRVETGVGRVVDVGGTAPGDSVALARVGGTVGRITGAAAMVGAGLALSVAVGATVVVGNDVASVGTAACATVWIGLREGPGVSAPAHAAATTIPTVAATAALKLRATRDDFTLAPCPPRDHRA